MQKEQRGYKTREILELSGSGYYLIAVGLKVKYRMSPKVRKERINRVQHCVRYIVKQHSLCFFNFQIPQNV